MGGRVAFLLLTPTIDRFERGICDPVWGKILGIVILNILIVAGLMYEPELSH